MRNFITLLAVLLLCNGLYAQNRTVRIGNVDAEVDQATVPVFAENINNVATLRLFIEFDKEVLTFKGLVNNQLPSQPVVSVDTINDSVIRLSWITGNPRNLNGKLFDLLFDFSGDSPTQLRFDLEESRFNDSQFNPIPNITYINGSVGPDPFQGQVSMTNAKAVTGGPVTMPITIGGTGFSAITNFNLEISIDTGDFEFVSVNPLPVFDHDNVEYSFNNGVLLIEYDGPAINFTSTTHAFDINLKFLSPTESDIMFISSDNDFGGLQTRFNNGVVTPVEDQAELLIESIDIFVDEINPDGSNSIEVPLHASNFDSQVISFFLLIEYDSDQMTFSGVTGQQFSGWAFHSDGNVLMITWEGSSPQLVTDDVLANLIFNYSASVQSDISFLSGSLVRAYNLASMPVEFLGGSVAITDVMYTLELSADPAEGGIVSGAGTFPPGTNVTIDAVAEEGFAFMNWTTAEGVLFSETPENTFLLEEDLVLIANFESLEFEVKLSASPEEGGTVSGEGTYIFGDEVTITAEANEGYQFINWTNDEGQTFSADASTTFNMPSEHVSLTANFELIDYIVTLQVSPLNTGTVTGDGTYNFNDDVTVTATPNTGYIFVNWTDTSGEEVSSDSDYLFNMPSENVTLVANFARVYTVTFNVNMTYVDGYYHPITFNAASDQVFVTGSMFEWAEPGTAMASEPMVPSNNDPLIFTKTIHVEPGEYAYKYYVNEGMDHGEWDGEPNRAFFVINNDVVINDWFGSLTDPTSVNRFDPEPIKVYPNPVRSILNVESADIINEVRIIDMLGQVIYSAHVNDYRTQLHVSSFRSSIYFLQVISDHGMETHRIQVTR